jgi:CRP/FNR family transcriptional regulator, cyclic AMP receptor protein
MLNTKYPLLAFPLLAGMRPDYQAVIAATARDVSYVKRQRLFAQGGAADGCWLIERGRIAIDALRPGYEPVTVDALGPGDVAGWSWLVPPYRWRFGAVALTEVHAAVLDTDRLRELAADDPMFGQALALAMLRTVAFRVEHARSRLLDAERMGGRLS